MLKRQLEIIHEYIEERATHRITWIIIWLIVIACMVEAVSLGLSLSVTKVFGDTGLQADKSRAKWSREWCSIIYPERRASCWLSRVQRPFLGWAVWDHCRDWRVLYTESECIDNVSVSLPSKHGFDCDYHSTHLT